MFSMPQCKIRYQIGDKVYFKFRLTKKSGKIKKYLAFSMIF